MRGRHLKGETASRISLMYMPQHGVCADGVEILPELP